MDENTDADIRTRDLDRLQRSILDGRMGKPFAPTQRDPAYMALRAVEANRNQAHPRRTDWYRVAALTIVILAACAAAAALIVALALVLTAF